MRCRALGLLSSLFFCTSTCLGLDEARHLPSIDPGAVVSSSSGCGTLLLNSDASYENGYAWNYGGVFPPYYGAFAECYDDAPAFCAVVFDFTKIILAPGLLMDVYVWDDAGGIPGNVLRVLTGVDPGPIAEWPSVSRHVIELSPPCCVPPEAWVGYWGAWPGYGDVWFVAADLNGPGGCPMTNIYPGLGVPSGWQNVGIVWGPTQALGIGAEAIDCAPVPMRATSWGSVKRCYQ
ncbi:MAG: hypothetical protein U0527_11875 [Candidatus Eisenbacteria bacterium]